MLLKKLFNKFKPKNENHEREEKVYKALTKSRFSFSQKINSLFINFKEVDEKFLDELEEILITSDVNVNIVDQVTEKIRYEMRRKKITDIEEIKGIIVEELFNSFSEVNDKVSLSLNNEFNIILVVGVNGVGKTTTIAKLAHNLKSKYSKIGIVAADTFRAGAVEQLKIWSERLGVNFVGPKSPKQDPASVIFDGIDKAQLEKWEVLICDTAGRLENKQNLMAEIQKIHKIIQRKFPNQPMESLLILDATTGQNGISQALVFNEACGLTGIILTKMDGSSKGGIVLSIAQSFQIPIKYLGVGEAIDDLIEFNAKEYIYNLISGLGSTNE
ncbi:MAG: signal recognition particle-docking protein FtsY [Mycoplasma sp.]